MTKKTRKTKKRKYPKLTKKERARAGRYIAEEYRAGRRGKQAVAIGLSRLRQDKKKSALDEVISRYL